MKHCPDVVAPLPKTELSTKFKVDIPGSVCRLSSIVSYHPCYPSCLRRIQESYLQYALLHSIMQGLEKNFLVRQSFISVQFGTTNSTNESQTVSFP